MPESLKQSIILKLRNKLDGRSVWLYGGPLKHSTYCVGSLLEH